MYLEIAQSIVDAATGYDIEAVLKREYSGRFMYGDTTAGIVFQGWGDALLAFALFGQAASNDEVDELGYNAIRSDSMGLGIIVY